MDGLIIARRTSPILQGAGLPTGNEEQASKGAPFHALPHASCMPCHAPLSTRRRIIYLKKLFLFPLPPTYSLDIFTLPQLPLHHRTPIPMPVHRFIGSTRTNNSNIAFVVNNWRLIGLSCAQFLLCFCFCPCVANITVVLRCTLHKPHLTSISQAPKPDQPTNQPTNQLSKESKKKLGALLGWFSFCVFGETKSVAFT